MQLWDEGKRIISFVDVLALGHPSPPHLFLVVDGYHSYSIGHLHAGDILLGIAYEGCVNGRSRYDAYLQTITYTDDLKYSVHSFILKPHIIPHIVDVVHFRSRSA